MFNKVEVCLAQDFVDQYIHNNKVSTFSGNAVVYSTFQSIKSQTLLKNVKIFLFSNLEIQ